MKTTQDPTKNVENLETEKFQSRFKFFKSWIVTDIKGNIIKWEHGENYPKASEHKVLDTFDHYVELDKGDLYVNGVRVGKRKQFIDIRLKDGQLEILTLENPHSLDDDEFRREYLNAWTDGNEQTHPIRIGDRIVGTAIGDIEKGDYEFSIHDRDFLLKLNQEPVESRPNENDRSLRWCKGKNRKEKLSSKPPIFITFAFNPSDKSEKVLTDQAEDKNVMHDSDDKQPFDRKTIVDVFQDTFRW